MCMNGRVNMDGLMCELICGLMFELVNEYI